MSTIIHKSRLRGTTASVSAVKFAAVPDDVRFDHGGGAAHGHGLLHLAHRKRRIDLRGEPDP